MPMLLLLISFELKGLHHAPIFSSALDPLAMNVVLTTLKLKLNESHSIVK
jgi:hypothetical protein